MSLEALIQRILDKGTAEKSEIISAAKREMEKLLEDARKSGQLDISRKVEEAGKAAERLKVQEIARAELESRKIGLAAQKEVLDTVKAETLRQLSSQANRTAFVKSLLEKYETDWRAGKVFCAQGDQQQVKSVVGSRLAGTIDCSGGIVIESDDGTRKLDLRFETLLDDIWEDSVKEMADLLWPKR